MEKSFPWYKTIVAGIFLTLAQTRIAAQTISAQPPTPGINMEKARKIIDSLNHQFSKEYKNGDSVALANHYSEDAEFGNLKGREILGYWANAIRNSPGSNSRNLLFTTVTVTTDGEFLIELGLYELRDIENSIKKKGKYLVVYKQENGGWKIYRDIGL